MKTTVFLTKTICGLFILFSLSFFCRTEAVGSKQECQWVSVDQNSVREILTMIGERVRENHYKISTWHGKVNILSESFYEGDKGKRVFEPMVSDRPLPRKIKEHHEFTREFALDIKGLVYESYYSDGQNNIIDVETGRELKLKQGVGWGRGKFILTPDYHIDCMDIKNRDGVIVRRDVIKQARPKDKLTCRNNLPPVFDPRDTMIVFGNPLWKTFAQYLAYIDKHGQSSTLAGYTMKVAVEECNVGDVKKYKITLPAVSSGVLKIYTSFTLVCSSEAGFNVVSYLETANYDRVLEHKTWDYGLINGVYLPLQTTKLSFDYQTGNLSRQSTSTFIDQKANVPISDEVFTYKNLGLQNGDKFIDRIRGKKYTYQDGKLTLKSKKK
ncbi:MAG: hypothetical protein ACYSU5_20515 [Planctomycetota bacterium]